MKEFPSLIKLQDEFKSKNFIILAVNVAESKKVVKKFAAKKKLPFPVLMDVDGKVARAYGVRAHPAHFLINGNGELIGKAIGAKDWTSEQGRNLIRHLIKQNK